MLLVASVVFVYYTVWALVLVRVTRRAESTQRSYATLRSRYYHKTMLFTNTSYPASGRFEYLQ